jgi:hypothetical protein
MCSLVSSAAGISQASEVEGTITGTVLTEDGLLAAKMRVCTSVHQTSGGFDHTVTKVATPEQTIRDGSRSNT